MVEIAAKTTKQDFLKAFPSLVQDVLADARKFNVPQNALDWLEKVLLQSDPNDD